MMKIESIIRDAFLASTLQDQVAALYLLGSAAKGTMRPDSDIDLAILPLDGKTISLEERLDFTSILSLTLLREIDLGIITAQNLIYASEAILLGKRIIVLDPTYTSHTEMRLLGGYLQLRLDRREVEEAYHAA